MNEEITKNLQQLKEELSKLAPAVEHLETARGLIDKFAQIHDTFAKHLSDIEFFLTEENKEQIEKMSAEILELTNKLKDEVTNKIGESTEKLDQSTHSINEQNMSFTKDLSEKLKETTEKLTNSNDSFNQEIKALLESYSHLAGETTKLIEKIGFIDFPNRLEKLDTTVSSINLGLQNTQTSIRDFERNLRDVVNAIDTSLRGKLEETTKLFKDEITKQAKEIKLMKILLFSSLGLSVLLVILSLI